MPLKISLRPNEKIFIGGAVVQNGDSHADLSILSDVPLLREKDILTEETADSHCKKIYLCVQLMYMDTANLSSYQHSYIRLIEEAIFAAPSTMRYVAEINNDLACGRYYQALKSARKLVDYEQELIAHANKST
jgi:flagellar biosynthesis repressor protein FlbT